MTQQAIVKQGGGVLNTPVGDKDTLEALIGGQSFQAAVAAILPDHLKVDRILKMALVAASRQPKLYQCTQGSIIQSLMRSAELGLDCSGTLGLAYLVPFWNSSIGKNECQLIPGYRGIIELAKRANPDLQIEARVVYANDEFEFSYGLTPVLNHKPTMGIRGDIIYVYCISREPKKQPEFTVMTREEIDLIKMRSSSKSRDGKLVGPWVSDYSEMARKTVTKRHAKYLSLSVEVQDAISLEDDHYRGRDLGLASEVSQNVGVGAMKNRLNLVKDQAGDPETLPADKPVVEPEPKEPSSQPDAPEVPVEKPETLPADDIDAEMDRAIGPDDDAAAEREAIEAEGSANGDIQAIEKEREEAEMRIFDLRKNATEVFRALEKENPSKYVVANKWLGAKSITQLTEAKLNEFLKKFA